MKPSVPLHVPADIDPRTPEVPRKAAGEAPGWFQQARNVNRVVGALYLACALLLATDLFYTKHFHSQVEEHFGWLGFYGFYGFVSCVLLVMLAKGLRQLVMRPPEVAGD